MSDPHPPPHPDQTPQPQPETPPTPAPAPEPEEKEDEEEHKARDGSHGLRAAKRGGRMSIWDGDDDDYDDLPLFSSLK